MLFFLFFLFLLLLHLFPELLINNFKIWFMIDPEFKNITNLFEGKMNTIKIEFFWLICFILSIIPLNKFFHSWRIVLIFEVVKTIEIEDKMLQIKGCLNITEDFSSLDSLILSHWIKDFFHMLMMLTNVLFH